jgi:hypothetical protein
MFQTDASWQDIGSSQLLAGLFGEPGLRAYRCFEVAVNLPLFHLDVLRFDDSATEGVWSRFILYDLRMALDFMADERMNEVRLSVQTPLMIERYQIAVVIEIVEGIDRQGKKFHICRCTNNDEHVFPHALTDREELVERRSLWQAS